MVVGDANDEEEEGEPATFRQGEGGPKRCKLSLLTEGKAGTARLLSSASSCEIWSTTSARTNSFSGTAMACRSDNGYHVIEFTVQVRPPIEGQTHGACAWAGIHMCRLHADINTC